MSGEKAETVNEEKQGSIKWDESNLKGSYANVCNVASSREEISLFFGTNQAWNPTEAELTVELTNRITLNPFVAKRLHKLLENTIKEYETRFGELKLDA